jgi:phage terminase large subunit GpA-like protein
MAAEVATHTAQDVALELVATKVALAELLDRLTGTTPTAASSAMHDWAYSTPVDFPHAPEAPDQLEHEFAQRLFRRSSFIEAEMLEAASAYLAGMARSERTFAETYDDEELVNGR